MSRLERALSILLGLLLCLASTTTLAGAVPSSSGCDCVLGATLSRTPGVETTHKRVALDVFSHESAEPIHLLRHIGAPLRGHDERAVLAALPLLDAAGAFLYGLRPVRASSQLILSLHGYDAPKLFRDSRAAMATNTPKAGVPAPYDPDFALGQLTSGGNATAAELEQFGSSQGWTRSQTPNGPVKFTDENGVVRITIKEGSARAPGSDFPHVEVRNAAGERVDPYGNPVTRKSVGNHTPIRTN